MRAVNVTQYKCEPGDVLVDGNMVAALQPFHFDVEAIEVEEPPHAAHQTGGPAFAKETRGATFYRIRSLGAALRAVETDFEPRLLSRYTHRKSQPLCNPLEYRRFFETITKCA